MNLEGHTHKVKGHWYNPCRHNPYKHKYKGFYENFTFPKFINREERP